MRRALGIGAAIAVVFTSAMFATAGSALADPSAADWAALRHCESSGNYSIDTGNGYFGAYQFDQSTWDSVGGSGRPNDASPAEQDYRALYLYRMRGWSPWTCASIAGLREDASAGSGVVPTRAEAAYIGNGGASGHTPVSAGSCRIGSSTPPRWGGQTLAPGNSYRVLVCWQKELGSRGFPLTGTGNFGVHTLAALHQIQAENGIPHSDRLGKAAWDAAWDGTASVATPGPKSPSGHPPVVHQPAVGLWPGNTAASCHVGARTAPAWPGKWFTLGADDKDLACWQMQMGHRGYNLVGSGRYGANTLTAAKDIQDRNHLGGTGLIGENTWRAAWQGVANG